MRLYFTTIPQNHPVEVKTMKTKKKRLTPEQEDLQKMADALAGLSERQYILVKGVLIGLGADLDAKVS